MQVTIFGDKAKISSTTKDTEVPIYGLTETPFVMDAQGKVVDILIKKSCNVTIDTPGDKVTGVLLGTQPFSVKSNLGGRIVTISKYHSVTYHSDPTERTIVVAKPVPGMTYTYHYMTSFITWKPLFHHFLEGNSIRTTILAVIESAFKTSFVGAKLVTDSKAPSKSYSRKESLCESFSMSSKDESSSDSGIMMLKYQTDDVIVPGQNIHRIDDEVTNSITSNFVIDLSANRQLAHQRIVYQLTQNYPPGKHYFYDAQGDPIDSTSSGEYRSGSVYKRDFGSTAEFTAFNTTSSYDKPEVKGYNIVSEVAFNRQGPVYLRWESSGYEVTNSNLEFHVDDGQYYFRVTDPGTYRINMEKRK